MPREPPCPVVQSTRRAARRGVARPGAGRGTVGEARTPSTRGCSRHRVARRLLGDARASAAITLLVTREYEHLVLVALRAGRRGPAVSLAAAAASVRRRRRRGARRRARRQHAQPESGVRPRAGHRPHRHARSGATGRRPPARAGALALPPRQPLPARPGADRRRAARQRRRAERRRPPRRRRRLDARLVAALHRDAAAARTSGGTTCSSTRSPPARTLRELVLLRLRAARARPPARRHRNFPVDRRGVDLLGRDPRGRRARPHAAALGPAAPRSAVGGQQRLRRGRRGRATAASRRSRGCPAGRAASASTATSRSSARRASCRASSQYAPGLDLARSVCGVHAVDVRTRRACSGSLTWPAGNQIFAVERVPRPLRDRPCRSPPARGARPSATRARALLGVRHARAREEHTHEHRLPAPDARRHVRERGQHHPPLPRRPSRSCSSIPSSRRSARGSSTTS